MVHCDEHISDTTPQFTGWSMTMTMKIINKTEKKSTGNFQLILVLDSSQWRIQDFPEGEPITRPHFPENCMEMKKPLLGGPKFVSVYPSLNKMDGW